MANPRKPVKAVAEISLKHPATLLYITIYSPNGRVGNISGTVKTRRQPEQVKIKDLIAPRWQSQ